MLISFINVNGLLHLLFDAGVYLMRASIFFIANLSNSRSILIGDDVGTDFLFLVKFVILHLADRPRAIRLTAIQLACGHINFARSPSVRTQPRIN